MEHIKNLILRMADDELIIGHRNSEWTGIGPIIEEDIAFSSMAQDKIGHALANYSILEKEFKMQNPDHLAFFRKETEMLNSQLTELPNHEYDFSLVRHFLFDHAEFLRYEMLTESSFAPLANLSKKIKGELKYHVLHADTWLTRLGNANEESHARMQSAMNQVFPYALGIFEESPFESQLISEKVFAGEKILQEKWLEKISPIIAKSNLKIPAAAKPILGGRKGFHTEHLSSLLKEMSEVISSENEGIEW